MKLEGTTESPGDPLALVEIGPVKPPMPVAETFTTPDSPGASVRLVGDAASEKSSAGGGGGAGLVT